MQPIPIDTVTPLIPTISEADVFAQLVQKGIDSWTEAGQYLVSAIDKDPHFIDKVRKAHPEISFQMLLVFERIGRKLIYAPLLADNSVGARALLELPYELQERYMTEPLDVVINPRTGRAVKRQACELTRMEVKQVFAAGSIVTAEDQIRFLKNKGKVNTPVGRLASIQAAMDSMIQGDKLGYYTVRKTGDKVVLIKSDPDPKAQPVYVSADKTGYLEGKIVLCTYTETE